MNKSGRPRALTKEQETIARDMRQRKRSLAQIARHLGVGVTTVFDYTRDLKPHHGFSKDKKVFGNTRPINRGLKMAEIVAETRRQTALVFYYVAKGNSEISILVEKTGLSYECVRRRLQSLVKEGLVEQRRFHLQGDSRHCYLFSLAS